MITYLTFGLLVLLLFMWYFTREKSQYFDQNKISKSRLTQDYFIGLNYLLNEQDDRAIEIFIKLFEVDKDTVETHLALGSLFRKRGEVDRAIRIHQNLIARPKLTDIQKYEGLLALGRDYLAAGVLDRAEKVFIEVIKSKAHQKEYALEYLLDIYQREKLWEKAISVAWQYQNIAKKNMRGVIAHYYCEITEQLLERNNLAKASKSLKAALKVFPLSMRANLLKGKLALIQGKYREALKFYKKVIAHDVLFLYESLPGLMACYKETGKYSKGVDYLKELNQVNPHVSLIVLLVDALEKRDFFGDNYHHLIEQLQDQPSLTGLIELISIYSSKEGYEAHQEHFFTRLVEIGKKLLAKKSLYRCLNCGLSGKQLLWYCPGCKKWDTTRPIISEFT